VIDLSFGELLRGFKNEAIIPTSDRIILGFEFDFET
jgi:hypothetical protein